MTFRQIKPIETGKQTHLRDEPSLWRACVNNDRREYDVCEWLIMESYRRANDAARKNKSKSQKRQG